MAEIQVNAPFIETNYAVHIIQYAKPHRTFHALFDRTINVLCTPIAKMRMSDQERKQRLFPQVAWPGFPPLYFTVSSHWIPSSLLSLHVWLSPDPRCDPFSKETC